MLKRVELLTRAGCCLCHTARAQLDEVRAGRPFDLVEIDIDGATGPAPHYRAQHGLEIPVVRVDGEVIARLRLDDAALARLQQALSPRPGEA